LQSRTTYHPLASLLTHQLKLLLVRLLLVGYALMVVKPVLPILADKLAHKYWGKSHFNLVHKHGGATHVHNEIGKLADDGPEEKSSTPKVKHVEYDVYCIISSPVETVCDARYTKPLYGAIPLFQPVIYPESIYQPPRC
jgi:hypothetical protein